jgi:hypothetical protein
MAKGRGTNYKSTEIAALAKAYMGATDNPVVGADQRVETFIADFLARLKVLAPDNLVADDPVSVWCRGKSARSSLIHVSLIFFSLATDIP